MSLQPGTGDQEASRARKVRRYFEDVSHHLAQEHVLRLRQEAVVLFAGRRERILDIGCGDGSLSLPLLGQGGHLTLVDTSRGMLEAARSRTPPSLLAQVDFRGVSFLDLPDDGRQFDLIICAGLLAHVESPLETLDWLAARLLRGGLAIIEHTDAAHPVGAALVLYSRLRSHIRSDRYAWNRLAAGQVDRLLASRGLTFAGEYRYGLLRPLQQFLSQGWLYRLSTFLHGWPHHPRWRLLGSERICAYRRA